MPEVTYPDLPVTARREDLLAALRDHQVVVVAGETGSGKTTQLPKLCLELGRGVRGTIAHTQPRRLAARTVAERLAEELGVGLGEAVGYSVRFTDRTREDTLVRLMTDGLLLAEVRHDPLLRRYDTSSSTRPTSAASTSTSCSAACTGSSRGAPTSRSSSRRRRSTRSASPRTSAARRWSRSRAARIPSRSATGPSPPRRDQVDAIGDAVQELAAEGPGTCSSSSAASARSATPPRACAAAWGRT